MRIPADIPREVVHAELTAWAKFIRGNLRWDLDPTPGRAIDGALADHIEELARTFGGGE